MFICVTLYQWHSSFTHSVLDSFVSCLATKGGSLLVFINFSWWEPSTPDECYKACMANEECLIAAYLETKRCYLKSKFGAFGHPDAGHTTIFKYCYEGITYL